MKLLKATYKSYGTCHLEIDVLMRRYEFESGADKLLVFVNINNITDFERYSESNVPFFGGVVVIDLKSDDVCSVFSDWIKENIEQSDIFGDCYTTESLAVTALHTFGDLLCNMLYDAISENTVDDLLLQYEEFFAE